MMIVKCGCHIRKRTVSANRQNEPLSSTTQQMNTEATYEGVKGDRSGNNRCKIWLNRIKIEDVVPVAGVVPMKTLHICTTIKCTWNMFMRFFVQHPHFLSHFDFFSFMFAAFDIDAQPSIRVHANKEYTL